jgi:hypothetical protein
LEQFSVNVQITGGTPEQQKAIKEAFERFNTLFGVTVFLI